MNVTFKFFVNLSPHLTTDCQSGISFSLTFTITSAVFSREIFQHIPGLALLITMACVSIKQKKANLQSIVKEHHLEQ